MRGRDDSVHRDLQRPPQPTLARLAYQGLRVLRLPALARRLRDSGVILCYHNVVATTAASGEGDASLHLPLPVFERQVKWLVSRYNVMSLREFMARLEGGDSLRHAAVLTFDDAYLGVFRHAWPVLQRLRLPATVFVVADAPARGQLYWWDHPLVQAAVTPERRRTWLEDLRGDGSAILPSLSALQFPSRPATSDPLRRCQTPADWSTIAQAARTGLAVGVHSLTHRSLPALSDAELISELVSSREIIERETATTPEFFAYPYGLWDARVRDAVQSAGYQAAVTLDYGLNGAAADPLTLRRVNVPAGIADATLEAWLVGLRLRRDPVSGIDSSRDAGVPGAGGYGPTPRPRRRHPERAQ